MNFAVAQEHFKPYTQPIEGTVLSFVMQPIPGGAYTMGSLKGNTDEQPAHHVQVDPFWMGTYEVTWDLYEPFVYKDFERARSGGNISPEVDAVTRPTKPYLDMTFGMGKDGHPALAMTQYNAIQFCKWLYIRTGIFYRLPTEAEWEYACRAGSDSEYYFGDDAAVLGDYAWYRANSEHKTHPVGQKKPNAWGLYDMHGNVAEWTYDQYIEDFYQQFEDATADNPVAVPEKLYPHSIRGGSFEDSAADLRSASRLPSDPSWKQLDPQIPKSNWWFPEAPFIGIRLVRPLNPPSEAEIRAYYDKAPIKDY
ncbi:formylglycine-generating enzyme family protein [Parapedobacter koreensis]|uniref:formylglycine-generating enzyme family protein n=1 Tax=Parapedobacter koreensis TaxID=332977 RepID=UPI001FDF104F|nr:formylglycine-generating enzyme family protein [Parapedobacter koreensis]